MATKSKPATKTLLVQDQDGYFKIEVPECAKITMSPISPDPKSHTWRESRNWTLRIYRTEKEQLACFSGVQSFRDLSIPYFRQVVEENGKVEWTADTEGNVRETKEVKKKRHFIEE